MLLLFLLQARSCFSSAISSENKLKIRRLLLTKTDLLKMTDARDPQMRDFAELNVICGELLG